MKFYKDVRVLFLVEIFLTFQFGFMRKYLTYL